MLWVVCCQILCRAELPAAKKHSGHNRHTQDTRIAAVIALAKAYEGGEPDYQAAAAIYETLPAELSRDGLGNYPTKTLKGYWKEFRAHGDVKDAHRSGRPKKISRKDALAASELVKAGRQVIRKTKAGELKIIVPFANVREAVAALPELKKIMVDNHTDPKKLYEAMKREDKYLVRRKNIHEACLQRRGASHPPDLC